jgi:hypothetical protein
MSLGFRPKIYLRGAMPIYSNMMALATDLFCGGVFSFGLHLHVFFLSQWESAHVWSYLPFCKHEY